jgi:hypothetical protein
MHKVPLLVAFVAVMTFGPAYGQGNKDWCTDAHMAQMDAQVAKMTDATKKKAAQEHLQASKDAMKKGDTAGCIKHMEEAHKSMGI